MTQIGDMLKELGLDERNVQRDLPAIQAELARRNLCRFGTTVLSWWTAPRHIRYLASFLQRAERGESKRLAISIAPGHGKSLLLQLFSAWFLGRDPRRRILALSASEMLSRRNSRAVRGIVQCEEWPWSNVRLVGESLEEWQTPEGGGVRAIGRTGTVTGFRAELILADDVQPDAGSETTRAADEEWFRQVVSTRLEPDGIVVLIQTRWSDDDLIGRLAEGESGDQWTFVNIPAIALEDSVDPFDRAPGEALWPERWPRELLMQRRAEITPTAFSAQYQGDPVPAGGAMFAPEWFEHRYTELPRGRFESEKTDELDVERRMLFGDGAAKAKSRPLIRIQFIDSASTTSSRSSRTVIATLCSDTLDIYLEHLWIGQVAYPELKRATVQQYDAWRPTTVYVEYTSNGIALVDELRKETSLAIVPVKIKAHDSKEVRAQATTGMFEAGRIKFPREAPWMPELLGEFLRFPHGKRDDIVDAVCGGITKIREATARARSNERFIQQIGDFGDFMGR